MLLRRLLLALGVLALVAGVVLAVLSLRVQQPGGVARGPTVPPVSILAAVRDLPPAALLRSEDLKWTEVAGDKVPPGAFVRGKPGESDPLGAATRREFKAGDPIVADGIIRPTQVGFLPAVLAPGMRAIALSIDAAAVGAGLIQPADHVDVILTQNLESQGHVAALKSVGETILSNIRVIAVDQTTNLEKPGDKLAVAKPARVPQLVTLEVSETQAQTLLVAHQLGRLQLSLRGLADSVAPTASTTPLPTWATQVSPALRALAGGSEPGATASMPAGGVPVQAAPVAVDIFRGSKPHEKNEIQTLCFSEKTHAAVACGKAPAAPAAEEGAAGTEEGAPAAAPAAAGKQGALSLPAAARAV